MVIGDGVFSEKPRPQLRAQLQAKGNAVLNSYFEWIIMYYIW